MKYLILAFCFCCTTPLLAQTKVQTKANKAASKDRDGIDGRMKGPNGEVVYIGSKGGRYYINASGKRVYLPYEGNKNKALKKAIRKAL